MHTVLNSADTPQVLRRACRVSGEYRQLRIGGLAWQQRTLMRHLPDIRLSSRLENRPSQNGGRRDGGPTILPLLDTTDGRGSVGS
jgi:hypothetical protein